MPLSPKGPGPIACRTIDEADFIDDLWPCEGCGERLDKPAARITIRNKNEPVGGGRERLTRAGFCSQCATKLERVYEYPDGAEAPENELGGASPSTAVSAGELESIGSEALKAPTPDALDTDAYWRWRDAIYHGRLAFAERAKFGGDWQTEIAQIDERLRAYDDAKLRARHEAELEAQRAATYAFKDELLAEHRKWLASGGSSGTRLELEGALIETMGIKETFDLSKARLLDCALILQVFDYSEWKETEFSSCRGFYSRFGMAKFGGAKFTDCRFKGAAFTIVDWSEVVVTNSDFAAASFVRSNLVRARLKDVCLSEARFGDTTLDGTVFDGCDLRDADFASVNPTFAHRGTMKDTVFRNCDLRGAKLADRSLAGARFENCQLASVTGPATEIGDATIVSGDVSKARLKMLLAKKS